MPTSRSASRASSAARTEVLTQLKEDHKRVKKAYRDFQKLHVTEDREACVVLVNQVLEELTVHATLEEELLYPAARGSVDEGDLIDEAEVEHESMKTLIEQLRALDPEDDKYCARFTVLCEYVLHHVKEEESEMFPQLERARLGWESMASAMAERRAELLPTEAEGEEAAHSAEQGNEATAAASSGRHFPNDPAREGRNDRTPGRSGATRGA